MLEYCTKYTVASTKCSFIVIPSLECVNLKMHPAQIAKLKKQVGPDGSDEMGVATSGTGAIGDAALRGHWPRSQVPTALGGGGNRPKPPLAAGRNGSKGTSPVTSLGMEGLRIN